MKTPIKIIGIVILAVIALAVVLVLFLDSLIRSGVEKGGSYALGVDVELEGAHLSILKGRLALSGLRISNPEGFKGDTLFEAGKIAVDVRPGALMEDEITIDSIILEGPSLMIEQSAGATNLSQLLEGIGSEGTQAPKPKEGEKTFLIETLRIDEAKVTFASFATANAPVTVPLPPIEMKDISSEDGTGLTLAQLAEQIFAKILRTSLTEGKGLIPGDMMKEITGSLRDVVPGLTQGLMEQTKDVIKGLFGK